MNNLRVLLCIPTLNPAKFARPLIDALKQQTIKPDKILIMDSSSDDGSLYLFAELAATIITINRADFDHGGTRNLAFQESTADIYIFLTQDAIPLNNYALENLVGALTENPSCGLVYGRQAPAPDATAFASHARLFNYPEGSDVVIKSKQDIPVLGIKTAFCSNSFAAYRRVAMEEIGYFPSNTLFAEDNITAAKLLQKNWTIGYVPSAVVTHSHNYSMWQDFCRYFDIGASHSMNNWYIDFLGKAEGEGMRFVRSEYHYLKQKGVPLAIFKVIIRNGFRWLGYKIGHLQGHLPIAVCRYISSNKAFWGRMKIVN
ncbi:MAG: glycosyltransferase [Methylovulum sp.]|nr:glycosyltransferase [Methylovulum sp.]